MVSCSDGIIEAQNEAEDMFGCERTAEVIRQAGQDGLEAAELVERLVVAVRAFAGEQPQGDDQTIVVLKVG